MNSIIENETGFVQYVTTGKLSAKGQLVLPKEFRDEQGLKTGAPIAILRIGNSLLLLPEMEKFNALCASIEQTLHTARVAPDELLDTLPETRRELFRQLYPELAENESKL